METKEIKAKSLSEIKDKFIGKPGTPEREEYEYELRMDVLGKMIKTARQERHLTQEQLGKLVGVQKAQISKLENSANSATIDTVIKVFKALKAEINFKVKLENNFVELITGKTYPIVNPRNAASEILGKNV
jgi:transcriptional regulator with XRE-family HTH domain